LKETPLENEKESITRLHPQHEVEVKLHYPNMIVLDSHHEKSIQILA
jgi:hypothetical protein